MPKYRLLSIGELQELEKEFVNFLILNGIAAEDWNKLKIEDIDAADKIVELFSDVVFEKIFRKVEFLDYISPKEIRTFQCLNEKIVLVGIKTSSEGSVDFTDTNYIQKVLANPSENFKIYSTEKKYTKVREQELFEMTTMGCVISDGRLFKAICMAFPK